MGHSIFTSIRYYQVFSKPRTFCCLIALFIAMQLSLGCGQPNSALASGESLTDVAIANIGRLVASANEELKRVGSNNLLARKTIDSLNEVLTQAPSGSLKIGSYNFSNFRGVLTKEKANLLRYAENYPTFGDQLRASGAKLDAINVEDFNSSLRGLADYWPKINGSNTKNPYTKSAAFKNNLQLAESSGDIDDTPESEDSQKALNEYAVSRAVDYGSLALDAADADPTGGPSGKSDTDDKKDSNRNPWLNTSSSNDDDKRKNSDTDLQFDRCDSLVPGSPEAKTQAKKDIICEFKVLKQGYNVGSCAVKLYTGNVGSGVQSCIKFAKDWKDTSNACKNFCGPPGGICAGQSCM